MALMFNLGSLLNSSSNSPAIKTSIISLLTCTLLSLTACSNTSMSCNLPLAPQWANIEEMTQDITVLSSVEFAGRKTNTQGSLLSQSYISQRFAEIGLVPWGQDYRVPFEYDYQFSSRQGINVIGIIPSKISSNKWRVITAHYDHLGQQGSKVFHGADDNASGVAGLLAIAKHWHLHRPKDVNLMLVATDAEEQGLYGSYALVKQLTEAKNMQIELAMNLDMIGHPSRPRAIYIEGEQNFAHFAQIKDQLSQKHSLCIRLSYAKLAGSGIQRMNWLKASDHYPFHKAGIAWIYFGVPPHSQYHTTDDTIDTLDLNFLASVTEMAYSFISQQNSLIATD